MHKLASCGRYAEGLPEQESRLLKLLKYEADRLPVAFFFTLTAIDLAIYFFVGSLWVVAAYWLAMIPIKGFVSAWNHHHQHVPMFKAKPLNRLLELSFAFHTGATTNAWVLHHVHGHHKHYLDQDLDESRWRGRNGNTYNYFHYTFVTMMTAYTRAWEVGQNHPRLRRAFLGYGLFTLAIAVALVVNKPFHGLLLFVFPMITSLTITIAATYRHHSHLDTKDHMQASRNYVGGLHNKLTGNLGYHTAHHYRQGVHWSKLPELHASIEDKIPEEFITTASHFVGRPGKIW